jgi:signal peptidase II
LKLILVSFLILITDQISKIYVKGFYFPFFNLEHSGLPKRSIPVIHNFLYITPIENPGIAFGINLGPDFKTIISIFTVIATVGLLIYFFRIKKDDFLTRFSVAVILGGALGNLTDRIFYGYFYGYGHLFSGNVVDFLDLRLFGFFFMNKTFGVYVFNVADVAITVGVAFLLFALTKKRKQSTQKDDAGIDNNLSLDGESS